MWCPVCGDEFVAGVSKCPDHGVALVGERPRVTSGPPAAASPHVHEPPPLPDPDDLVEYDLTAWSTDQHDGVIAWLEAENVAYVWSEPGVLAVPRGRADDVEEALGYLASDAD